jgi:hypothetical protein
MPLHVPAITFAWVHLSLLSNVCRMELTRLLHTLWRMNLCLPSLKKWGHCVAGLLISSSCKLHEELGMKALLHFVQILGFLFSSTWFTFTSFMLYLLWVWRYTFYWFLTQVFIQEMLWAHIWVFQNMFCRSIFLSVTRASSIWSGVKVVRVVVLVCSCICIQTLTKLSSTTSLLSHV